MYPPLRKKKLLHNFFHIRYEVNNVMSPILTYTNNLDSIFIIREYQAVSNPMFTKGASWCWLRSVDEALSILQFLDNLLWESSAQFFSLFRTSSTNTSREDESYSPSSPFTLDTA
jgi:hypothetical protein